MIRAAPTEVESDTADAEYREAIDAHLRDAAAAGQHRWETVLQRTEGADPRLVARRARACGVQLDGMTPRANHAHQDRWDPELHARDFEWYFTADCAQALASRAAGLGTSLLCLGTPTVAGRALAIPSVERVTLVDRNPLTPGRHRFGPQLETVVEDLDAARIDRGRYDVAIFDAPWYPDALRHWLTVAAGAVTMGGVVLFALLPRLHRPDATADRRELLAVANRWGTVTVHPAALHYRSPRFEREALTTAGVATPEAWRRADLVELTVHEPVPHPVARPRLDTSWARYVVGSQVIHLDRHAPTEPGELLTPIGPRTDFRYGSISTRDPNRAAVGLWTSRSRVACVRRPEVVAALLERLADTGDIRALERDRGAMSEGEHARVLGALDALLDLPSMAMPGVGERIRDL